MRLTTEKQSVDVLVCQRRLTKIVHGTSFFPRKVDHSRLTSIYFCQGHLPQKFFNDQSSLSLMTTPYLEKFLRDWVKLKRLLTIRQPKTFGLLKVPMEPRPFFLNPYPFNFTVIPETRIVLSQRKELIYEEFNSVQKSIKGLMTCSTKKKTVNKGDKNTVFFTSLLEQGSEVFTKTNNCKTVCLSERRISDDRVSRSRIFNFCQVVRKWSYDTTKEDRDEKNTTLYFTP